MTYAGRPSTSVRLGYARARARVRESVRERVRQRPRADTVAHAGWPRQGGADTPNLRNLDGTPSSVLDFREIGQRNPANTGGDIWKPAPS